MYTKYIIISEESESIFLSNFKDKYDKYIRHELIINCVNFLRRFYFIEVVVENVNDEKFYQNIIQDLNNHSIKFNESPGYDVIELPKNKDKCLALVIDESSVSKFKTKFNRNKDVKFYYGSIPYLHDELPRYSYVSFDKNKIDDLKSKLELCDIKCYITNFYNKEDKFFIFGGYYP